MRRSGLVAVVLLSLVCGRDASARGDEPRGPQLPWIVTGCASFSGARVPCGYAPAVSAPPLDADEEAPLAWAWVLHRRGKHAAAEDAFREAHDLGLGGDWLDAQFPALMAKYNLGLELLVGGRPLDAEPLLRQAQITMPGWQPANALGIALAGQGRFAEAEAAYREAVRFAAGDASAAPAGLALVQRNLAFALARGGKFDEARTAMKRALELVPDDPEFKAMLREIDAFERAGSRTADARLP